MVIDVSVQYNGGFSTDIQLLTVCYYHPGNRLICQEILSLQPMFLPKRFDIFSRDGGMLRRFGSVRNFI